MKIVITGANSAVGLAILRCGPKHEVTANTFVAAVRSDRARGPWRQSRVRETTTCTTCDPCWPSSP